MDKEKVHELMVTHLEKRFAVILAYADYQGWHFTYYGAEKPLATQHRMESFLWTYFGTIKTCIVTSAYIEEREDWDEE
jgi:hypothetical protein